MAFDATVLLLLVAGSSMRLALPAFIVVALAVLPGCLEQQPFGRLDRSELAIAARAPSLRAQRGAALLVRVTHDGRGCSIGRARVRTLVSAINGGAAYTIGQKRILERDPAELAMAEQMRELFGVDSVPKRRATVRAADVAYIAIPPGDYIVTRIECQQDGRGYVMGADYGDDAPPPGEVFGPVKGHNMISIKAGEIVDAGMLDMVERERGLFKTRAELVASPTPEAYRTMLGAALPDLAGATVYRSFTRFSACETLKSMKADASEVARSCEQEKAQGAAPGTAALPGTGAAAASASQPDPGDLDHSDVAPAEADQADGEPALPD
jgi:hypothetical protein